MFAVDVELSAMPDHTCQIMRAATCVVSRTLLVASMTTLGSLLQTGAGFLPSGSICSHCSLFWEQCCTASLVPVCRLHNLKLDAAELMRSDFWPGNHGAQVIAASE